MTGVINVGVRLPAVIFPVVIRPSGGLTPLISLSVSLFSVSACLSSCVAQSVSLSLYLSTYLPQRVSPSLPVFATFFTF